MGGRRRKEEKKEEDKSTIGEKGEKERRKYAEGAAVWCAYVCIRLYVHIYIYCI